MTVTAYFFGWNASQVGVYLALQGLLMFPANLAVAWASQRTDDRELILCTLVGMTMGAWGIVHYGGATGTNSSDAYSVWQYIFFGIVIFEIQMQRRITF